MKTVLFVPGFQENIDSRDYKKTIAAIENAGYKVRFVSINWFRTTIEQWVIELDQVYEKYEPRDTILAGFSFGAMTAFMSASKRNPSALWLFSLSPFFSEDLASDDFKKSWLKSIGKHRENSFKELRFSRLIQDISSRTTYFYGEAELKQWSKISYRHKLIKKIPNTKEILIANGKHDVASDIYIDAIKKEINTHTLR